MSAIITQQVVLFAIVMVTSCVLADKQYIVVASESATSCPGNRTRCSLMYYAAHSDQYFRESNTTFYFLTGHHQLINSTAVTIMNISNLTLYGTSVREVSIICDGEDSGGFLFYNITNFTIKGMNLNYCSIRRWKWSDDSLALCIKSCLNVTVSEIIIRNTPGLGITLKNIYGNNTLSNVTVERSHFTNKSKGINLAMFLSYTPGIDWINNITVLNSYFNYGLNLFENDNEAPAGGITISAPTRAIYNIVFKSVIVRGNQGRLGGNYFINLSSMSERWITSIILVGCQIFDGVGHIGGGLAIEVIAGCTNCSHTVSENIAASILKVNNTYFEKNTALFGGGGVYIKQQQSSQSTLGRMTFNNCTFKQNQVNFIKGLHAGVGVHIIVLPLSTYKQRSVMFFEVDFNDCDFINNIVVPPDLPKTGALYAQNSKHLTLNNSRILNSTCSGIVGINSNFLLFGENEIRGNGALKGGGIFLCTLSMLYLHNGSNLYIIDNHSEFGGGGIYIERECSPAITYCFFQVENVAAKNSTLSQTQIHLINNTAGSGSAIYGGAIDSCILYVERGQKYRKSYPAIVFENTFHIKCLFNDLSIISSDPVYIGFCGINSSTTELNVDVCPLNTSAVTKPGKVFSMPAVIMGQRYGLVSGIVLAKCITENCNISSQEYTQFVVTNSTQLNYTVFAKEGINVTLKLLAEDYFSGFPTYQYTPSFINVTVEKCPLGFIEYQLRCSCLLPKIECNLTNQTIYRSNPEWIGYKECCMTNSSAIIYHPYCPLGYCTESDVSISTDINYFDQSIQCTKHRQGLLCGKCKQNYTLRFGSSHCVPDCSASKSHIILYVRIIGLIVVCGVAGILLVVMLTLLNLTVTEGTLNGLIFYANIVQVNVDTYYPSDTYERPWTALIAWLNLDFGVTTCFYDGMNAYVKTWLQFVFPLYLWLISGGIVYCSRKSKFAAKLAEINSVKVLATLFLLSFGKMIRTIIAAVFFTNIKSFDGTVNLYVWLLDPDVNYLQGKHIYLFLVSSVVGIFALLYAMTLTFIQCLRKSPNGRMCRWVWRFKPLLDAYTGPYTDKYHFWTGLLLLIRIGLLISFALNFKHNPTINLTMIITSTSILMLWVQNGVYINWVIGLLESSLYLNLILFSAFTILSMNSTSMQKTMVVWVFSLWILLTLLCVILSHGYKQFYRRSLMSHLKELFTRQRRPDERAIIQPLRFAINDGNESEDESNSSGSDQEPTDKSWANPHLRESV